MASTMGTTQFMNAKLAKDKPIFTRAKIAHNPAAPINFLNASNRRIFLVLGNRTIEKIDQTRPDSNRELIDVTNFKNKFKVFLP